MKITKCDICGQIEKDIEHYKLKKKVYDWYDAINRWEYIDICTECLQEIRTKVRQRKRENYE